MLKSKHWRAKVARVNLARPADPPHWAWIFVCHEIVLNGHASKVFVCGEGHYRTRERAWKCLKMHALGKHDTIL